MSMDLSAEHAKKVALWAKTLMDLVAAPKGERSQIEVGLSTARGWAMEQTPAPVTDTVSDKQTVGVLPEAIRSKGSHGDPTMAKALGFIATCRRCHRDVDMRGKAWTICPNNITCIEDGVTWREKCGARIYAERDGKDPMHDMMLSHLDSLGEAIFDVVADMKAATPIMGSAKVRSKRDPKSDRNEKQCVSDTCERMQKDAKSRHCKACSDFLDDHPDVRVVPKENIASRELMAALRAKNRVRVSGPQVDEMAC